jgi:transposase
MVFSLEHDIKVTKSHQNLLPTQSVLVAHTVFQNGIEFDASRTKKQLWEIIEPTLQNFQIIYEIDVLLAQNDIDVLRLPPYHCQYNPIELAWAHCKCHYNKHIGQDSDIE